jgi:formylglycine-generating enzyme required for sulfatase activity
MGAEPGLRGPNRDLSAHQYEGPIHTIALEPFFLAKHELTQAQWGRVTHRVPSQYNPDSRMRDRLVPGREWLHPVESVSWAVCERVLGQLGLALPTEAQGERAGRAGAGTRYCGGDDRDVLIGAANLADASAAATGAQWPGIDEWPEFDDGYASHAPVDELRPNAYGLHHVQGNVFEWCQDWFIQYDSGTPRSGDGLRIAQNEVVQSIFKIARGGSHRHGAGEARLSYRYYEHPSNLAYYIGVRPARRIR